MANQKVEGHEDLVDQVCFIACLTLSMIFFIFYFAQAIDDLRQHKSDLETDMETLALIKSGESSRVSHLLFLAFIDGLLY